MLKWAKQKVRVLILHQAGDENAIASANTDVPQSLMIAAAAQRATNRLVAISSAGFDALALSNNSRNSSRRVLAAPATVAARATLAPRRPGVHARWKEQNRVPFQKSG